jgi:hypothetical protein
METQLEGWRRATTAFNFTTSGTGPQVPGGQLMKWRDLAIVEEWAAGWSSV